MEILKYGNDLLTKPSNPIDKINDEILDTINKLKICLANTPGGIGLAAPQIGIPLQISVIDLSILDDFSKSDQYILINPVILEGSGSTSDTEGCLSFPRLEAIVKRKEQIKVKYLSENNKEITTELNGFVARVFQHEIDHLNGILIIDHISSIKKQILKREIRKLIKLNEW